MKLMEKINNIKKEIKNSFDYILLIYLIINILYINIGTYLVIKRVLSYLYFSYGFIVYLVINIFFIRFIATNKLYKKNKIDIFLKLIAIVAIISSILAFNIKIALFGFYNRYEGLFVILYYLTLTFLSSFIKKEHKKIVAYSILLTGVIQAFYSICQRFELFGVITLMYKSKSIVYGFSTNPNFFGSLMTLSICYSIGLFIDSKKISRNILFIITSCIIFIGLILSNTLSAVVGLGAALIFLLIYSIKNKCFRKYLIICILFGYILSTMHYFNLTVLVKDLVKTKNETSNIVKGNVDNSYGTYRVEVWKKSIKIIPKYIVHGVGVDNFAYVLNGKPIQNSKIYFDKAHNEYLQTLITMGIFGLLSYLCLHFIIVKNGIKNAFKTKEIYLILPIIGYIVQAQFNISVIEVAPFFYIGLGLLVDR